MNYTIFLHKFKIGETENFKCILDVKAGKNRRKKKEP